MNVNEESRGFKKMGDLMGGLKQEAPKKNTTPHELAAVVDEIQKVLGFKYDDKYGYKYWLRKAKGFTYSDIIGILKEVSNADPKYSKGNMLTNKLAKLKLK